MTASRADYLQKRLTSEGLGTDAIQGYIQVLRQFLTAKMTKMAFEDAISKVLPKDKFSVHNSIILELLHRAQMKREGQPDVPVLQPVKEKRSNTGKNASLRRKNTGDSSTDRGTALKKRKLAAAGAEKEANGSHITAGHRASKQKHTNNISVPSSKDKDGTAGGASAMTPNAASNKHEAHHAQADMPSNVNGNANVPARNALGVPPAEIPTYDTLSFQPVRPGQAIDIELFFKMRARMAAQVERMGIAGGVKDEAVALVTHALEHQVKRIMESCVRNRQHREGGISINHTKGSGSYSRFKQTKAVAAHDLREGMLRDIQQLGNDPSEALERLSLLL